MIRIHAVQHEATLEGIRLTRVILDKPPVAAVSQVEAIMGRWWHRSGGYPVGRIFGTPLGH